MTRPNIGERYTRHTDGRRVAQWRNSNKAEQECTVQPVQLPPTPCQSPSSDQETYTPTEQRRSPGNFLLHSLLPFLHTPACSPHSRLLCVFSRWLAQALTAFAHVQNRTCPLHPHAAPLPLRSVTHDATHTGHPPSWASLVHSFPLLPASCYRGSPLRALSSACQTVLLPSPFSAHSSNGQHEEPR